jgi:hypothetical protein
LDPDQLMREGEVRAEVIVLTNDLELDLLHRTCPQAVPRAVVAGNIAFDRLVASLGLREQYRRAFDVSESQKLVVVTSTWSQRSAFGRYPDLFERVLAELPDERYRVVGLLHPQIWSHHGCWQVRAWLADCLHAGLRLVPPEEGWRAALVAADYVIGDYGSVTSFAAGVGAPVLLVGNSAGPFVAGSPIALLSARAPRWRFDRPLTAQLHEAAAARTTRTTVEIRGLLTSRLGQAGGILRRTMYRLLKLREPARAVPVSPVPLPVLVRS